MVSQNLFLVDEDVGTTGLDGELAVGERGRMLTVAIGDGAGGVIRLLPGDLLRLVVAHKRASAIARKRERVGCADLLQFLVGCGGLALTGDLVQRPCAGECR